MVFRQSFRLLEADNMDVAIAQNCAPHIRVVLLDVLMPKADGIKCSGALKKSIPAARSHYVDRCQLPTISGQSDGLRAFDLSVSRSMSSICVKKWRAPSNTLDQEHRPHSR